MRGKPLEPLTSSNLNISIETSTYDGLESTVIVAGLAGTHSGEWSCRLETAEDVPENQDIEALKAGSRSVNILVVSERTRVCEAKTTKTSKGTYKWTPALAGHTAQQECRKPLPDGRYRFAYLHCRQNGLWAGSVNTSQCDYNSKITSDLHKFAGMNMTFNPATMMQSANHFLNFTEMAEETFRDPMDIAFFAKAVENFLPFLHEIGELGHYMISMIENVMSVDPKLFAQSQSETGSCDRIIHVINNVTVGLPAFQHHTNRLAVESYSPPTSTGFRGVTCTWYSTGFETNINSYNSRFSPRRVFHCTEEAEALPTTGKRVLASITLPSALYPQLTSMKRHLTGRPFTFSVFSNASFFPSQARDKIEGYDPVDVQNVIGATFFGKAEEFGNLTHRVIVAIRGKGTLREPRHLLPVYWDTVHDRWDPSPCALSRVKGNLLWFSCSKLGYYSFMEVSRTSGMYGAHGSMPFRFHHPLVYVGSAICMTLVTITIMVYALSFNSIR